MHTSIEQKRTIISPAVLKDQLPLTHLAQQNVATHRQAILDIMKQKQNKLLVVVGPCSIDNPQSALEYAKLLKKAQEEFKDHLHLVMRVYFEKPRTKLGWKGLINDPHLNDSFHINEGLFAARELLLEINQIGIGCATEFLDVNIPQYMVDLISWSAIGARTCESQIHRECASGLPTPVGFKNRSDGAIEPAINAMLAAARSHHYLAINDQGALAIFQTSGNPNSHIILRGGQKPNYSAVDISYTLEQLQKHNCLNKVMIDCSHGNAQNDYRNQMQVVEAVSRYMQKSDHSILGLMLESYIHEGKQTLDQLNYKPGKSVTDACISWPMTYDALAHLHQSFQQQNTPLSTKGNSICKRHSIKIK